MADVIVIGAGATGITAAIAARELGASVIVLEAERHIGGHAICSGGNLSFGGGNIYQKKYGVEDSPERLQRGGASSGRRDSGGFRQGVST